MIALTRAARRRKRAALHASIVAYLAAHPDSSGLDVSRAVQRHAMLGLLELEQAKQVTSCWADGPYPRRRLYRLAGVVADA